MEPTESIVFGGPDREFVSLSLAAPDSEGWLSGEIEIRAGGFFGRCRGSFFRRELRRFSESLAELYRISLGARRCARWKSTWNYT
jgi:hypothetical protein